MSLLGVVRRAATSNPPGGPRWEMPPPGGPRQKHLHASRRGCCFFSVVIPCQEGSNNSDSEVGTVFIVHRLAGACLFAAWFCCFEYPRCVASIHLQEPGCTVWVSYPTAGRPGWVVAWHIASLERNTCCRRFVGRVCFFGYPAVVSCWLAAACWGTPPHTPQRAVHATCSPVRMQGACSQGVAGRCGRGGWWRGPSTSALCCAAAAGTGGQWRTGGWLRAPQPSVELIVVPSVRGLCCGRWCVCALSCGRACLAAHIWRPGTLGDRTAVLSAMDSPVCKECPPCTPLHVQLLDPSMGRQCTSKHTYTVCTCCGACQRPLTGVSGTTLLSGLLPGGLQAQAPSRLCMCRGFQELSYPNLSTTLLDVIPPGVCASVRSAWHGHLRAEARGTLNV